MLSILFVSPRIKIIILSSLLVFCQKQTNILQLFYKPIKAVKQSQLQDMKSMGIVFFPQIFYVTKNTLFHFFFLYGLGILIGRI